MGRKSNPDQVACEIIKINPRVLQGLDLSKGHGECWNTLRKNVMNILAQEMSYSRAEARDLVLAKEGGTAKKHARNLRSMLRNSPDSEPTNLVRTVLRSRARKQSDLVDGYVVGRRYFATIRDIFDELKPRGSPPCYQNFKERFKSTIERYGTEKDRRYRISLEHTKRCFVRKENNGGIDARLTPVVLMMTDGKQHEYPNLLSFYRDIRALMGIADSGLVSQRQFCRNFKKAKEAFAIQFDESGEEVFLVHEEQLRENLVFYESTRLSEKELLAQIRDFERTHTCRSIWSSKKLVDRYQGYSTKLPFECGNDARHGVFYKPLAKKHQGCPACNKKESNSQQLVRQIVSFILPDRRLVTNRRPRFLNGLELDISTPEELPEIAIEVNGIQHYDKNSFFHSSDEDFVKLQENDSAKLRRSALAGVNLIVIDYTLFPRDWGGACRSYRESVELLIERLLSELRLTISETRLHTLRRRTLPQLAAKFIASR